MCRIAELRTPQVSAGHQRVAFYLIDAAKADGMRRALAAFGDTLPSGTSLTTAECPGTG